MDVYSGILGEMGSTTKVDAARKGTNGRARASETGRAQAPVRVEGSSLAGAVARQKDAVVFGLGQRALRALCTLGLLSRSVFLPGIPGLRQGKVRFGLGRLCWVD